MTQDVGVKKNSEKIACASGKLGVYPERFQVILAIEVKSHGGGCDVGTGRAGSDEATELAVGDFSAVRGAENPPVRREACHSFFDEAAVIFFHSPDAPFFITRKGGRIQHNGIKGAALACEAVQPVKGITLAEEMG